METKEDFIREIRELLNANEKVVHVELDQIVDMVHELAESYRYQEKEMIKYQKGNKKSVINMPKIPRWLTS